MDEIIRCLLVGAALETLERTGRTLDKGVFLNGPGLMARAHARRFLKRVVRDAMAGA